MRFTPTRVGKTIYPLFQHNTPHGSPPRVWGKLFLRSLLASCWRFTPTRVGKTRWPTAPVHTPAVHPHACGEND